MFRGGGNLRDASLEPKTALEAAKRNLDAKMQRGIEAKSVTENTKSILAPMAGEEAIVHERLVSVTSAGAGELAANSGDEHESIVGCGCYPNNETDLDVKMRRCMGCFKKRVLVILQLF